MTVSTPDIQALIEEANGIVASETVRGFMVEEDLDVIRRMAAALSALSGETETEWEYRHAETYRQPNDDPILYTYGPGLKPDDSFATHDEAYESRIEDSDVVVRRRKAGPWVEVV